MNSQFVKVSRKCPRTYLKRKWIKNGKLTFEIKEMKRKY